MPAGTITLTNDSNIVDGSGTSFTSEFASGDVLASTVGEVTYTLFIKSVDSDTQVTLVKKYDGPTATGLAWSAIPRNVAIAIPAQIATEVSKAMRGMNLDKQNWQLVFSSTDDLITVTLPDGTQFTGVSWLKLSEMLQSVDLDAVTAQAIAAAASATAAATSETNAAQSATAAASSESNSAASASAAATSENNAATSATQAGNSATAAATSEVNAAVSATNADKSAADAADAAAGVQYPVSYEIQNLTDIQKEQARINICARPLLDYIRGLDITVDSTLITVGTGEAFIPGVNKTVSIASELTLAVSGAGLTASSWYHIYLFDDSGTAAIEISTTEPVDYAKPAKQKTGDDTRRYIGSFRVTAGNTVIPQFCSNGNCNYEDNWGSSCRVLSAGTSNVSTSVVANTLNPSTAIRTRVCVTNTTSYPGYVVWVISRSGRYMVHTAQYGKGIYEVPLLAYPYIYYYWNNTPPDGGAYIDIGGYTYER
ncbi:hypothetical protein ABC733_16950 [Mangrovibacter sp. SLW1]